MKNLQQIRKDAGFTQVSLAVAMDVTVTTIQRWEYGAMKPTPENQKKLDELLKINDKK